MEKRRISCECTPPELAEIREGSRLDGRKVSNFLLKAALMRARQLITVEGQKSLIYKARDFLLEKDAD